MPFKAKHFNALKRMRKKGKITKSKEHSLERFVRMPIGKRHERLVDRKRLLERTLEGNPRDADAYRELKVIKKMLGIDHAILEKSRKG